MTTQGDLLPDDDRTRMAPAAPAGVEARGSALGAPNALPPGTRLGEFEITALIGEGGFGIVYLADDVSLQRKVALKEYLPSALAVRKGDMTVSVISERYADTFQAGLRSFINEAQLLARFDHPSLVKVYRFWQANGTAYMVMPYYEGVTLKEALRQLGGPPDESWLKNILGQLMEALEVIHAQQCFHRDIAPDNILLLNGNRAVLLDFGAARRAISDMTQALTVILKPGYAPIEQYAESPSMKQGPWTDCYALASVVYFAITGKPPAPAVERIVADPIVPLARTAAGRYSDRFLRGIDAALTVRPEARPRSIAEFRELLGLPQRITSGSENGARDTDGDVGQRVKLKIALPVLGVMMALVAVGVVFLLQRNQVDPLPRQEQTVAAKQVEPLPKQEQAATARRFEAGYIVDEILAGRDPTRDVTLLVNGARDRTQVRIGKDKIRISIRSSKPGFAYVFMIDSSQSHFYLLFPISGKPDIRIEANAALTFPALDSTGPPGVDRFLAVVSDQPRRFDAPEWQLGGYFKELPLDTMAALFGSPKWSAQLLGGTVVCPGATPVSCPPSFGAAEFSVDEVDVQSPQTK